MMTDDAVAVCREVHNCEPALRFYTTFRTLTDYRSFLSRVGLRTRTELAEREPSVHGCIAARNGAVGESHG
jgi:hypothetical protein